MQSQATQAIQATQTMQSIRNYLEDTCEFNLQAGANFIKISKKKEDEQEWKDYNKGNSKKNKKSKHKDKRNYEYVE